LLLEEVLFPCFVLKLERVHIFQTSFVSLGNIFTHSAVDRSTHIRVKSGPETPLPFHLKCLWPYKFCSSIPLSVMCCSYFGYFRLLVERLHNTKCCFVDYMDHKHWSLWKSIRNVLTRLGITSSPTLGKMLFILGWIIWLKMYHLVVRATCRLLVHINTLDVNQSAWQYSKAIKFVDTSK
jgi:hypothetical protein